MNQETGKVEWNVVREKIKNKFAKLSESEIDSLNGHMDRLNSTVQKAYGYDQREAEQECKSFNESLKKIT